MFTGIVEEVGKINSCVKNATDMTLNIACSKIIEDMNIGDSICVNGVCQTVVDFDNNSFTTNISDETLKITTFKNCKISDDVNLERALTLNTRLGGHIVTGHVDCCARLSRINKLDNFYNLEFQIPSEKIKYVVTKGSITVDGISLTVANIKDNYITIAVIPHTYNNTNLSRLSLGDSVNIETDILGKYVENFVSVKDNTSKISLDFLEKNGFV